MLQRRQDELGGVVEIVRKIDLCPGEASDIFGAEVAILYENTKHFVI